LLVGFQKFWIVNNNSTDNTSEVLLPYVALGIVNLTFRGGINQQLIVYNCVLPYVRRICYWVALLDGDEFVVPVNTHSVWEVLRRLEGSPGIVINWVVFGSNGKETMEDGLVIERFRCHVPWEFSINTFLKSIVNPRMVLYAGIHDNAYMDGVTCRDPLGNWKDQKIQGQPPVYDVLRLYHYKTKSYEEFHRKMSRGLGITMTPQGMAKIMSTLRERIRGIPCAVNDTMMNWAVQLVKANIAQRLEDYHRSTKRFSIGQGREPPALVCE
jgi:hypothetical protein